MHLRNDRKHDSTGWSALYSNSIAARQLQLNGIQHTLAVKVLSGVIVALIAGDMSKESP